MIPLSLHYTSLRPLSYALLIVLATYCLSGTSFAQENVQDRIKDLQEEYDKAKQGVAESKKRLKQKESEKKDVQKRIKSAEENSAKLNSALITIKQKESRLGKEIRSAQNKLASTESDLKSREGDYSTGLRAMYKRQRVSALQLLATEGSISTVMRGMKMFALLAREDTRLLSEIRSKKNTIESSMKTVVRARNAQHALAGKKKRDQQSLEQNIKQKQALLEDIKQEAYLEEAAYNQHLETMEHAKAEIEELMKSVDREDKKTIYLANISQDIIDYNIVSRKGSLPWPVRGKVVSKFGIVTDPKTKTKTKNRGIEIETRHGDPVYAIAHGVVVKTISLRGYGNLVWLYHPPNHYTIYAHLSEILVNTGSEVRQGDPIGTAGSTGLLDNSVSRLLLEVINSKNPENPLSWLKRESNRTVGL